MKRNTIYLIDFDGTITKQDTLDYIAKKFFPDKYKIWWEKLKNKEYSILDWFKEFEQNFNINKEDYDNALDEIEIDESFIDFSEKNNCAIVSGGFIYNIERVLKRFKNNINIEIFASEFKFINNKKCVIHNKFFNAECSKCGVCKTNILKEYRKLFKNIVFIGDGITDICVVDYSDKVYAKKNSYLEKYLNRENKKYEVFEKFSDIKTGNGGF